MAINTLLNQKDFPTLAAFNRARFDAIDRGDFLLPWVLRPCRIKILMVVDGYPGNFLNITYGQLYFSLSAVLDTLQNNPESWVKFDVTTAHRQTDPLGMAAINNFRFTQSGFNLNDYDQVWFFGARGDANDPLRLSDQELAIVSRWMDEKQGGVFATGDHADLGASLCSRIPRVRSMRKWTPAQVVPSNVGPNRHDTLLKGHDGYYTFNDESDDIPMPIGVKMFPYRSWSPFHTVTGPHPVLCGKKGKIDILPDHPHEGEVIKPLSLTDNFSFPGYANKLEYPEISGIRETPFVIATADVQKDHTEGRGVATGTDQNKGPANEKTFGVIGAYNGHAAKVGRVVVDSTWHHWFDVNLIGRPNPGDPIDPVDPSDPKSEGFLYSTAGKEALAKIKNYFRNVAIWLASPEKQDCMFFRATWWSTFKYPLVEQLSPKLPLWELGGYALDALGQMAGQCTTRHWIWDRLHPVWRERLTKPFPDDPCLTCPPIDVFEHLILGAIVREMLEVSYAAQRQGEFAKEEAFARAMSVGLASGSKAFLEMLEASLKKTAGLLKGLESNEVFTPMQILDAGKRKATKKAASGNTRKKK